MDAAAATRHDLGWGWKAIDVLRAQWDWECVGSVAAADISVSRA
jgi:hypothetical protein